MDSSNNRTTNCILTCYNITDELLIAFNNLHQELRKHNINLVIITQVNLHGLNADIIRVPYSLYQYGKISPRQENEIEIDSLAMEIIEREGILQNVSSEEYSILYNGYQNAYRAFEEIVKEIKPSYGMVWGSTFPQSLVHRRVLQEYKIPVVVIERGLLPQTLMLEEVGHGVDSILVCNNELWNRWTQNYSEKQYQCAKNYYLSQKPEKYSQGTYVTKDFLIEKYNLQNKKIILFLGQHDGWSGLLPRNTEVSKSLSPWFPTTKDALNFLLSSVEKIDQGIVLFKPHPHDPEDYDSIQHHSLQLVKDENLYSLFELSNVVVAMSTTAQFEGLWYDKPLLLLGKSQLSGKCIAYEYSGEDSLVDLLNNSLILNDFENKKKNARYFLYGLMSDFLYGVNDTVPTQRRIGDLAKDIAKVITVPPQKTSFATMKMKLKPFDIDVIINEERNSLSHEVRLIAFYLPQFHPIPENDQWWGKGFTEWTNVTKATPLFTGHYQPHLPADLGFYDLRLPEVRKQQAELAQQYGIEGFCYWHYWFNGKQLLEKPFQEVLESGEPDFPFCLAWANEHWSRRWNGMEQDMLQEQIYGGKEDDEAHIQWLIPAFRDKRYITVDGKPLFLIYNPSHLPDPISTITLWRKRVQEAGLPGIYLVAIKSHAKNWEKNWQDFGFDDQLIFQPNWGIIRKASEFIGSQYIAPPLQSLENIDPLRINYSEAWKYLSAFQGKGDEIHSVVPMWDNSARRKYQPVVLDNPSPEEYKRWLALEIDRVKGNPPSHRIVFLNAWNEWAEGNHLEPDQRYGRAFLEATKEAFQAPPGVVAEAYCDVALAALRLGDENRSQMYLQRAEELSDVKTIRNILQPKLRRFNAISKNMQAVTEFQNGNIDKALEILEQTKREYPEYLITSENLARLYYEKEEYEKALQILSPLLNSKNKTLYLSVLEGECQEAIGQKGRAISAYLQGCSAINDPYRCQQRIAALVEKPNGDDEKHQTFPLTSIIILTFNNLSYTQQCLTSVIQYTDTPYELIIVDNNSSDGAQDWLKEFASTHPSCQLILNSENLGFPGGINQGLKRAKGEYIVLLNNDTVVTNGWLRNLIKVAQSNPRIGLVGPMTNSVDGPQKDRTAWYVSLKHMARHAERTAKIYKDITYEAVKLRFYCVLITRQVLEVCGGLDERFSPGNCEDDDYCLRAQLAGFSIVIARNVFIHHYGSKSFTISGARNYNALIEENKVKFRGKWGIQIEDIGSNTKKVRSIPLKYPINKDEFQESVERAMFHIQSNEFEQGIQWIEKAIAIAEKGGHWNEEIIGEEEFLNLAGKVSLSLGNLEQAKFYFEKELQKNPQSSRACTDLGRTFYLSNLYEASKTMYEWAVLYNPDNEKAVKGLATVNELLGFYSEHNSLVQETNKETNQ